MKWLILTYNQELNLYWPDNNSNIPHLAFFLIDDVGCRGSIENWKEFFTDPKRLENVSNYSWWEKEGEMLLLGFEADLMEENPLRWETTVEQMLYILDCWKEVCEKKPKRFIITRDGDKVTCTMEMK